MRLYSAVGPSASGTANKTAVTVIGSTAIRPAVCDVTVGMITAPNATDFQIGWAVGRFTAAGTAGSSYTPLASDTGEVAATCTSGITHSGEPTYTAGGTALSVYMNQRATYRWVAQDGREIYGTAGANNGVGTYLVAATSCQIQATVFWKE